MKMTRPSLIFFMKYELSFQLYSFYQMAAPTRFESCYIRRKKKINFYLAYQTVRNLAQLSKLTGQEADLLLLDRQAAIMILTVK